MSVSSIAASAHPQPSSAVQTMRGDPDGGADRATEGRSKTPTDIVQLSAQAKQYLAASIANDADHGADGV